jgi:hypothetical protein
VEFKELVSWLFYGSMGGIALYIASTITKLRESVENLNINVAREIEKVSNVQNTLEKQERTIERHSDRLLQLEKYSKH